MLQPLPRAARRHSQRLAVPASAQPPMLLVADIEGLQVACLSCLCIPTRYLLFPSQLKAGPWILGSKP